MHELWVETRSVTTQPEIDTEAGIQEYVNGLKSVLDGIALGDVHRVIDYIQEAYDTGKHIFIVGNGGSAATASHMVCDLTKTVLGSSSGPTSRRIKAIALTDNVPLLTAWGNDTSYDTIFAEQLRTLGNHGDLLIVISASGNSPNIVAAVNAAADLGMATVGLLGFAGGKVKGTVDHCVVVASEDYGQIEDAHMILNHLITAHFRQVCAS